MKKSVAIWIILLFLLSSLMPITSSYSSYETNKAYSIHIDENGTLSGYVKDISMNPMEGVVIRAYCDENYYENVSDSSGYYYIDNISFISNRHSVCVFKTGYKTIWVKVRITENTKYDFVLTSIETIYVDDDNTAGPWNGTQEHPYQYIQDGINHAGNGDTVHIYSGTYFENVIVDKSIILVGENRNNTIIDGQNKGNAIYVEVYSVSIENLTIRNGTNGVAFYPSAHTLSYNFIISHNIIINNYYGVDSETTEHVNITGNIIVENNYGIVFCDVQNSVIRYNHILSNKKIGILCTWVAYRGSYSNSIYYNTIQKNTMGIFLESSPRNKIICNNFYQNIVDASFQSSNLNDWNHNYWNRPRILPKPVIGTMYFNIPWVNFDWHPAKEPYDIPIPEVA